MSAPPWEDFIRQHFPGYLLPASATSALTQQEASRFLERLTGRPHELALLRATSTMSPRMGHLRRFVFELLPDLVRGLPSRTETDHRDWEGGFQGRLEIQPTLALWAAGQRTRFVTRTRRRSFALPENVLVRATGARLLGVLTDLRQAKVLGNSGWGADAHACEGRLRHLLGATVLRDVPEERVESRHEEAAYRGRHPCHAAALDWHQTLQAGLDGRDPAMIAAVVAAGALSPLDSAARFEIAVVIRLAQAMWEILDGTQPDRWTSHRSLVRRDRREIVAFERDDGAWVRVHYNQSHLGAGPVDTGARHYLGATGRLRPDATVVVERGGARTAVVLEVKLTDQPDYQTQGFHEAMLYRLEYASHLHGWPKAILVTSARVAGAVREGDDVIAVGWNDWVPEKVTRGILAHVLE